ncbi:MAG: hypothetical protein QXR18_04610 [Pyrobaculum sp.]
MWGAYRYGGGCRRSIYTFGRGAERFLGVKERRLPRSYASI